MNTKKLLRLVTEILKNESKFNFQSSLNQLLLNYQQNNPDGVNNMRTEIYDNIKKSDMSRYVNSDFKILKNIEIFGYFDLNIELKIEKILNSQSHEINQKLTNFIQERDTLIQKLTNLQKSLTDLGIEIDIGEDEIYQLVFSFPKQYHKLDSLQNITKDINLFLRSISENLDDENKEYEIISVNDGCIEIFIQVGVELASRTIDFLDIILQIHGAIGLCREIKKGVESYSAKRKKSMEKAAEEELTEKKQDLIEHFVKSLKLTGENKNDNENRVRGLFRDMVKHFEAGVTAEVKTPLIEKPREPEENDDEQTIADLKRQLKLYQQKEHIDQVNQKLFSIQKEYLQLDIPNINNNEQ